MLFLVASVAFAIAAGGWWLQRIAFTPDDTRDTAAAILGEHDIRQEINTVITGASAPVLGVPMPDLNTMLEEQVLSIREGAAVMGPIIEQAHDRIIGNRDDPVEVTGDQMVDIVRDQRAAEVATVTLPIPVIGTLDTTRVVIGWTIPITAGIGLLALVLGVITRPERREVLRALGELCLALAASMLLFGYLIPVFLLTAIDNGTWTHAIPRLALRTLPVVIGAVVVFLVAGLVLLLASTSTGKRRQWSTPLSVSRYQGDSGPFMSR